MTTVKTCLSQKSGRLIHVSPQDPVQRALELMKENRVRSVLALEGDRLVGIITQGDCAIRVLLPGLDARTTLVSQIMTRDPMTVKPGSPASARFAALPTPVSSMPPHHTGTSRSRQRS